MARRRAKVARLPKEIRDGIDQRLQDGWKYTDICAWLAEIGHPEISEDNVRRWYGGGHQDFLAEQREVVREQHGREAMLEFARKNGGLTLQQASEALANAHTFEMLRKFDANRLLPMLKKKPELYFKMLGVFLSVNRRTRTSGGIK